LWAQGASIMWFRKALRCVHRGQVYTLEKAKPKHIVALMNWFSNLDEAQRWGGPRLRFPFERKAFENDIAWRTLPSYVILDAHSQMQAFGQVFERKQRHHMGRLVVHNDARGQALGQLLIEALLTKAQSKDPRSESSLLVYRDNLPAWHCYTKLGYTEAEYPKDVPYLEDVAFMVRDLLKYPVQLQQG